MRLRLTGVDGTPRLGRRLLWLAVAAWLLCPALPARAADAPGAEMSSAGWMERVAMKLEGEAMSDLGMLPDTSAALVREWRSFDRNGSALGSLVNLGWVALAALVALVAERAVARGLSRRLRRAMRSRPGGPTLGGLLLLLLCDAVGLAVFVGVFTASRHALLALGATLNITLFAAHVLFRWRIAVLVVGAVLRPSEPVVRLIALPDGEARRLARFFSATILAIIVLIGFGRYGLADEDSGAPHVIALLVAGAVFALNVLLVFRGRGAAEALIRGRDSRGVVAALRAGLARAWLAIGLTTVTIMMVFFVFGLSLGLLSYYHALSSTLGVLLVVIVLERLTERGWHDADPAADGSPSDVVARLVARGFHRILRMGALLIAVGALVCIWADIVSPADAEHLMRSSIAALAILFVAYFAWELIRLGIDRHLQSVPGGPKLPGADSEDESAPGSRLQTILPMVRVAVGALIAVVGTLTVLSRLGIDTAPLIAGAGVFGLAISFGAQSLVRDVISGLFYLWDDAFRVGEYIDTGRLKGTVEALGIRSVKVRHHNGPLHTIPYGQLGAVTNQSRDFATVKFNLRLEPGSDIELVRRTAKRVGLDMQDNPEIASEVILPLKLQGIAEFTDTAMVLRFKFTARPVKPSWVQREYLKALYRAFGEKGIAFATGALTLQTVPLRGGAIAAGEGAAAASAPAEALALAAPLAAESRVA